MTISVQQVMEQASSTAALYFSDAIRYIDGEFGEGYALKNPKLIEIYVQGAFTDYAATLRYKGMGELATAIENAGDLIREGGI